MNAQTFNIALNAIRESLQFLFNRIDEKHRSKIVFTDDAKLVATNGLQIFNDFQNMIKYDRYFYVLNSPFNCILGKKYNNYYRALHDFNHAYYYTQGKGTTKFDDEIFLNGKMCAKVFNHIAFTSRTKYDRKIALYAFLIMFVDLLEQANYYNKYKKFVDNQENFVYGLLCSDSYRYYFDLIDIDPNKATIEIGYLSNSFKIKLFDNVD